MKRNSILAALSMVLMLASSCQKTPVNNTNENGYLSFSDFALEVNEELITKSQQADGGYWIFIYDNNNENAEVYKENYAEVLNNDDKLSLPAGSYTLVARSQEANVPAAVFNKRIYGTTHQFTIAAGAETVIGQLTCTLLQCEVKISYSEDFLETVTGPGATFVEVTSGESLKYELTDKNNYESRSGLFAVNGNTMTVKFSGSIEGKTATMTKIFTGIAPRQMYNIKFVKKVIQQGNATFDIQIEDYVSDDELNSNLNVEEEILAADPNAPKDDGGIRLLLAENCDPTITATEKDIVYDGDNNQINSKGVITIPISRDLDYTIPDSPQATMSIVFEAVIPNGLAEMNVKIESDNSSFIGSVSAATEGTMSIDLVNPTCAPIIFDVVPFPHGTDQILGKQNITFDLSNAQNAIVSGKFDGRHLFTMTIVDTDGKEKVYEITMILE